MELALEVTGLERWVAAEQSTTRSSSMLEELRAAKRMVEATRLVRSCSVGRAQEPRPAPALKTLPLLAKTKDTQVWERLHMFDDNGGNPKSSSSTGGKLHMRLINNMHGRCRILGRGLINYGSLILAFFSSL